MPGPTHNVSRNSGLHSDAGTFGGSVRFNAKLGRGAHAPAGDKFYGRNQINKRWDEVGLRCTQGIGGRKELAFPGSKNVGPGSYEIIHSAAGPSSPLDGKDYCKTTIKQKLPSQLVPANMCSPGPHHKYEVRKPLDHHCPKYAIPPMARTARHRFPEDMDQPGPGTYANDYYAMTKSSSAPNVRQKSEDKKRNTVKCTFGIADRFRAGKQTCSPQGDMYYAHSKFLTSEDYLQASKSCTFGHGGKTDFANPYKGRPTQVSPVSYSPVTSIAYRTSALDGLVARSASPVSTAVKALVQTKKDLRAMGSRGSPLSATAVKDLAATAPPGLGASQGRTEVEALSAALKPSGP